MDQSRCRGEADRKALLAGSKPEAQGNMGLARSAVAGVPVATEPKVRSKEKRQSNQLRSLG
jgi:hypothetical protein